MFVSGRRSEKGNIVISILRNDGESVLAVQDADGLRLGHGGQTIDVLAFPWAPQHGDRVPAKDAEANAGLSKRAFAGDCGVIESRLGHGELSHHLSVGRTLGGTGKRKGTRLASPLSQRLFL